MLIEWVMKNYSKSQLTEIQFFKGNGKDHTGEQDGWYWKCEKG